MKTRTLWLVFGLGFSVTLAVIVGQRLSAEAMAVTVGVIAGVAASIPTSLIVVWFVTRTVAPRPISEAPPAPDRAEPRVVVVAAQPVPAGYQNFAGYPPQAYSAYPAQTALPQRRFAVIGGAVQPSWSGTPRAQYLGDRAGADVATGETEAPAEVAWPR